MADAGSESDNDTLAAIVEVAKRGLVVDTDQEPKQSFQAVLDGNHSCAASRMVDTSMLPAARANANADMDTSTATLDSSGSSSSRSCLPSLADVAECGREAGSKRRRMRSKARNPFPDDDEPPAVQSDPNRASDGAAGDEPAADPQVWMRQSTRKKRMFIGNRLRRMNWYQNFQLEAKKKSKRIGKWPERWTDLNESWKQKFVSWWALHPANSCGKAEKEWATKNFVREQKEVNANQDLHRAHSHTAKNVLLSYNGDWGDIAWDASIAKTMDMRKLTAVLQASELMSKLWQKVQVEADAISKRVRADDYAVSLEVCSRTLEQEEALRVRVELALVRSSARLTLRNGVSMFGSPGILAKGQPQKVGNRAGHSALYCVTVPKLGQLWSWSSSQPYKDFLVNGEWTWNLLQSGKITPCVARSEFLKGKKNLTRHLENLSLFMLEVASEATVEKINESSVTTQAQKQDLTVISDVVQWQNELTALADRMRDLVLNGPSMLGKT